MKVEKIFNNSIITPKTTGYTAATGLCLSVLSGVCKNKTVKKAHKPLAWMTAAATLFHIAQTEYLGHKYKKNRNNSLTHT